MKINSFPLSLHQIDAATQCDPEEVIVLSDSDWWSPVWCCKMQAMDPLSFPSCPLPLAPVGKDTWAFLLDDPVITCRADAPVQALPEVPLVHTTFSGEELFTTHLLLGWAQSRIEPLSFRV